MTDLQAGLFALGLVAVAVAGFLVYLKFFKPPPLPDEPVWTHIGTPPKGVEKALEIIAAHTPGMPQGGTIEWTNGPFTLYTGLNEFLAAGTVDSYKPIRIRVMYYDKVWQTALAHELGHVWSTRTHQGFGESPQDKLFVAWFTNINAEIEAALTI